MHDPKRLGRVADVVLSLLAAVAAAGVCLALWIVSKYFLGGAR